MSIWKTCFNMTAWTVMLSFTTILSAYQGNYQNSGCCEQQTDCCVQQSNCCAKNSFYLRGDVLYWTPRVGGLELEFGRASIVESSVTPTQVLTTSEIDVDPKFKWNAGYRVAAGFESNNWGIGAIWTSFHGKGSRNNILTPDLTNAGHVKVNLDQIDLVLAYISDSSCSSFKFKPFLGVRGTRIHEHISVLSFTPLSLVANPLALETRTFSDKQKYWGVGPVFGLNGDYEIGCGFGVYGTVAASLLYGNFNVNFDDTDIFTPPVSIEMFSTNKVHTHSFNYNVDLALGLSWHTVLCNQFEIGMKLGFEQHQYFDLNHLSVGKDDISFTGGVFALDVGF